MKMVKRLIIIASFTVCAGLTALAQDTLRLSLDECITMARNQSVEAAVARGELQSAYWQWRSYRADLLPEVSFSATLPSYNKRYTSYQQADGGVSFVRNDYLGLSGSLYVTQKIWPTGGTLTIESSLDFLHQSGMGGGNQFMSLPIAVTLSQPLFGVNHMKWSRPLTQLMTSLHNVLKQATSVDLTTCAHLIRISCDLVVTLCSHLPRHATEPKTSS